MTSLEPIAPTLKLVRVRAHTRKGKKNQYVSLRLNTKNRKPVKEDCRTRIEMAAHDLFYLSQFFLSLGDCVFFNIEEVWIFLFLPGATETTQGSMKKADLRYRYMRMHHSRWYWTTKEHVVKEMYL